MDIENRVQEEEIELEERMFEDVNRDLHPNADEVNIENQVQEQEIKPGMYISYTLQSIFYNQL